MENDNLQNQIDELKRRLDSLGSSTTIPLEVGEAMKKRLNSLSGEPNNTATTSYKTTKAIDEGGSATYNITFAKPMDGFISIVVNGNIRMIPYYV